LGPVNDTYPIVMAERVSRLRIGRNGALGTLYINDDVDIATARELERAVAAVLEKGSGEFQPGRQRSGSDDDLLTSAEVAELFGVDRTTVVMWAKRGRVPVVRTPGGQLRFRVDEIVSLLGKTVNDDEGE
jgi:excisionase family DNA binding protein